MNSEVADTNATTNTSETRDETDRSTGGLISKLASDSSDLLRTEAALARREMRESINDAKSGLASLVTGAGVFTAGLLTLCGAAALAMRAFTPLPLWQATLIVGGVIALIGIIMLFAGKKKLETDNLAPTRTMESLQRDSELADRRRRND